MKNSTTQMTRRRFLRQLAAAAGTTALAACGAQSSDTPSGGVQPDGSDAGATTPPAAASVAVSADADAEITFINWDPVEGTPYEAAVQAFQDQTGRKVKVQPAPTEEYETKIRAMLAGGTPLDVMRINDDFVRGYSVDNLLLDLKPYLELSQVNPDEYYAPIYEFAQQPDGTYTAWCIGNQPRLIYYNADMFTQANVPPPPTTWTDENWKWDDFLARAKPLTQEGERWGALVYDDTGYEQTFTVNNGQDEGIWSEDGQTFLLAEPKGVEAVQWVTDLTCVHHVQPERSMLAQSTAANQLFVSGKIGMFYRPFGVVPYMRENVKDFVWDVAPPPGKEQQKTEGSLIVFCTPKTTKNPEGAWELLQFLGGSDGGTVFAEAGAFVPAFKEAAALIKPTDQPPAHIELFAEAMNHNTATNFTENTERGRNIYRPQLDLVYNCQANAQDVLSQVRTDVEDALKGKF
jgi:multiple sugar transport system substrate-binding protein